MGGPANATWALRRVAGFQDEMKKYPNLAISTVTNENVDPAEGLVKFSGAVRVHPRVDWIYSTYNLLLPPGTVPSSYSKALYVAGGLDELTVGALKGGTASAILPDYPVSEGYLGVAYLVRKLNGEEPPSITCLPNGIVSSSTLNSPEIQSQNLFPGGLESSGPLIATPPRLGRRLWFRRCAHCNRWSSAGSRRLWRSGRSGRPIPEWSRLMALI
jgi:ABC-type sugar transport system substrate-binding protein